MFLVSSAIVGLRNSGGGSRGADRGGRSARSAIRDDESTSSDIGLRETLRSDGSILGELRRLRGSRRSTVALSCSVIHSSPDFGYMGKGRLSGEDGDADHVGSLNAIRVLKDRVFSAGPPVRIGWGRCPPSETVDMMTAATIIVIHSREDLTAKDNRKRKRYSAHRVVKEQ